MSSTQAPVWAFRAEAIDGDGDTHLPSGIHVRALPSPQLGLPATPLVVYRLAFDLDKQKQLVRDGGVRWVDEHGVVLTPPFAVTPDKPVYGYFPLPDVIWAELLAKPKHEVQPPPKPEHGDITELGKGKIGPFKKDSELTQFAGELDAQLDAQRVPAGALRFEAVASTVAGTGPIQSRSSGRYALAGWTIPTVRVVGEGTVEGIRWLDAARLKGVQADWKLWGVWSLPVDPSPRYNPTTSAHAEAKERVLRGAATRQPLYIAHTATTPGTAPSALPDDAMKRVDQVQGELDRWLKLVLHDTSVETWKVADTQAIDGKSGAIKLPVEPFILAGAVDPDVGHWLGFGDRDKDLDAGPGWLVLYRVRGLWRWRTKQWLPAQQLSFSAAVRSDVKAAKASFPELEQLGISPDEKGPFVDLHATAVALVGAPPDLPPTMSFDGAEDRGWLSEPPPPDVRRALRLLASEFRPHAVAALAAIDAHGDRTLHPYPKVGRVTPGKPPPDGLPLPLVVARPLEKKAAGEALFEDRDAPDGSVHYRLAEGDWFGRWSPWRTHLAPPKPRTPPMRPVIEIYPQPPTVPSPVPDGPLHGTITLRIPIPRESELPPGGARLARLDVIESFSGEPTQTVSIHLSSPAPAVIESGPPDMLVLVRPGPDLPRCGERTVSYTARWIDELGLVSPDALPAKRTIVDPRPPPPPPVITELRWTARPDVTGHARVDLDFASTVGTRYRVFVSNETLLLKALEQAGHAAAHAEILAAAPGAPRAEKFKAHKALFGWDHFECLTKQPIRATATTTRFVHRLSGSLEVLTLYRVLGEGPSGALSEMTAAELVPFAVPNLGPPTRPQIGVVHVDDPPLDPTTDGVKLRVKVPRSTAAPKAWRLRRTSTPKRDPLALPIVAEGPVSGAVVDDEGTTFDIHASAPLRPWRVYKFAVEVQADDPPGAPTVGVILPGEWSEASAQASLSVIPPGPPAAATSVAAENVAGGLQISFSHADADSLHATPLGPYRYEVWRVEPGQRPALRAVTFLRGAGDTWVATDAEPAPAGTYVTVCIIDPAGRRSDATPSNQI